MAVPVADIKARITLEDLMSSKLRGIQRNTENFSMSLSSLGSAGASLAAGFISLEKATEVFGTSVSAGYNLGVKMETAQMSIAGVLLSMTKLRDRQLEWNEALGISDGIIQRLAKTAMVTAATPTELIDTFSGLVGVGLGANMTLPQIEKIVSVGASAVKAFGLQGYQLIQEMRDLFAGTITTRASTVARALGITNKDIKAAREQGRLYEFLTERMQGFDRVIKEFGKTYQGAMTVASGATEQLLSNGLEPLRNAVKDVVTDFTNALIVWNNGTPDFNEKYASAVRGIGESLANGVKSMQKLFDIMTDDRSGGFGAIGRAIMGIVANVDIAAAGFFAWRAYAEGANTPLRQTLNLTDAIAESVRKVTAEFNKQKQSTGTKQLGLFNIFGEARKISKKAGGAKSLTVEDAINDYHQKYDVALDNSKNFLDESGKIITSATLLKERTTELKNSFSEYTKKLRAAGVAEIEMWKEKVYLAEKFAEAEKAAAVIDKNGNVKWGESTAKRFETQFKVWGQAAQRSIALNKEIEHFNNILKVNEKVLLKKGAAQETVNSITNEAIRIAQKNSEVTKQNIISAEKYIRTQQKTIDTTIQAVNSSNRLIDKFNFVKVALAALPNAAMSAGIALSTAGDMIESEWMSNAGRWVSNIGMLAIAFQGLWAAIGGPATIALTVATAGIAYLMENLDKYEVKLAALQYGTRSQYDLGVLAISGNKMRDRSKETRKTTTDGIDLSGLGLKHPVGPELIEEKIKKATGSQLIRMAEDANRLSTEITAKLAGRIATKEEQDYANLNKEIAAYQDRINGLKANGLDIGNLQEQLAVYAETAAKRIADNYDLLTVKTDELRVHLLNTQESTTSIISSGIDALKNDFINFGQNLLTEGGSFMDRFKDMFERFANDIINTLMKIYLNGILVNSVMGIFGGGKINTGYAQVGLNPVSAKSLFGGGYAVGGIASGWSLVGEKGPELVNFSNPGRVYTAQQTAAALGGGTTNIKVELKNESGTALQAQQGNTRFDGEDLIVTVVLNAIETNRKGMRNMIKGAMA